MSVFAPQFTRIKGLSDRRRLPRLGTIRLGFKIKKGNVEYPAELPFFFLPSEVANLYGFKTADVAVGRAKELSATRADVLKFIEENYMRLSESLEIMFPINDIGTIFPQAYKRYGSSQGVKCMGDGEKASTYDESKKGMVEIPCPCEHLKSDSNPKGECTQRANIMCIIPKVSMGGVYQIPVGSYNSIIDINSGLDYTSALIGRFAMVLLTLRRVPIETHHDNKKQVHYTLQVNCNFNADMIDRLRGDTQRVIASAQYLLPPPTDINPEMDMENVAVMQVADDGKSEDVVEVEAIEPAAPSFSAICAENIGIAKDIPTLGSVWNGILAAADKLTKEETKTLNSMKNKRKKELETMSIAVETKEILDIPTVLSAIKNATTEEEANTVWKQVESLLVGESKVKIMMAKDKKIIELKEAA